MEAKEMSNEEIGKELAKILDKWFGGTMSTDMHFDYSPEAEVVNFLKPIYVKAGMKEVVDTLRNENILPMGSYWQSKLKEWELSY